MINKTYRVIIQFKGAMDYEIKASNEDEAKEKAKEMFSEYLQNHGEVIK